MQEKVIRYAPLSILLLLRMFNWTDLMPRQVEQWRILNSASFCPDSVTSGCFSVTYAKGKMCSYAQKSEDEPCSITYPTGGVSRTFTNVQTQSNSSQWWMRRVFVISQQNYVLRRLLGRTLSHWPVKPAVLGPTLTLPSGGTGTERRTVTVRIRISRFSARLSSATSVLWKATKICALRKPVSIKIISRSYH